VGIGDLGDDLAALLECLENDADVEVLAERVLDADFDVVEVDEHSDVVDAVLCCQKKSSVEMNVSADPPPWKGHIDESQAGTDDRGSRVIRRSARRFDVRACAELTVLY